MLNYGSNIHSEGNIKIKYTYTYIYIYIERERERDLCHTSKIRQGYFVLEKISFSFQKEEWIQGLGQNRDKNKSTDNFLLLPFKLYTVILKYLFIDGL